MNLVVGSGPSGVAVARALLERGLPVTMLDAGATLDAGRAADVAALARAEPDAWDPAVVARVRNPLDGEPAFKRAFGSDYPYALGDDAGLEQHGAKCLVSQGLGGLSAVWGAAVLPALEEDLDAWPFPAAELIPHYAAVGERLGVAGTRGELDDLFPFHAPPRPAGRPTLQAKVLLGRLRGREDALRAAGVRFGASRLAVRGSDGPRGRGCLDAGLCLSGCPYGAIWNAADEVAQMRELPGFRYEGGVRVRRVEGRGGEVKVTTTGTKDGAPREFEGSRVFLAAGPLGTARIVLNSKDLGTGELSLKYQPYFLLPLLGAENVDNVATERASTLAQIFLELRDPAVSRRLVHLQIYTRNEFMADRLARVARWAGPWSGAVERSLAGRLLAIQGYFHSDEGEPLRVSARREGDEVRLVLRAGSGTELRRRAAAAVSKLRSLSADLGFRPVSPMLKIGAPGEGNHTGGLFPMRKSPGAFDTDRQGRLAGLDGVHLVDSSVLPSLSAATFTYAVMANARRIALEAVS